jgi:hypothetical protein
MRRYYRRRSRRCYYADIDFMFILSARGGAAWGTITARIFSRVWWMCFARGYRFSIKYYIKQAFDRMIRQPGLNFHNKDGIMSVMVSKLT